MRIKPDVIMERMESTASKADEEIVEEVVVRSGDLSDLSLEGLPMGEKGPADADADADADAVADGGTAEDLVDKQVEEVVVKPDGLISVDTTDKRSQAYRQANSYAAKKTVAQGMMDVALITANANQLRYLIEYQRNSPTFFVILSLIVISLILQIAVGISLIFKGRFDIKGQSKSPNARKINNYVVVGVFLITIINVFIAAFSITVPASQPLAIGFNGNP